MLERLQSFYRRNEIIIDHVVSTALLLGVFAFMLFYVLSIEVIK